MVKSIEEYFRLRLLRKIKPSLEKSERSLDLAKRAIKDAESMLKYGFYNMVIVQAYMGMFHSARALLYRDGIQEKSHFAMYIYLKEKYRKKIPLDIINLLNIHRIERHETLYDLDYKPGKEDAELALRDAKLFLKEIERTLLI